MAKDEIIVTFKPKGHKKLKGAIDKNSDSLDKLNKKGKGWLKSSRLLDNSFATMRSHLLLFNFAMGLGVRQIINFTKQAAKVESLRKGFDNLSGSTFNSISMMNKLKIATNGAMSEMDLMTQANAAMTLGVTKNADEMSEMFDIAQRLGRSLGVDTTRSIESLVTGLGRQSVKMLDNIGIIVKSDDAYNQYAATLNKTVDQLTDAEKRQAFFNAALTSARKKMKDLGPEVKSSQDSFDQFSAVMGDLGTEIGNFVLPAITGGMDKITEFLRGFTETDLERTVRMLTDAGIQIKDMGPLLQQMSIEQLNENLVTTGDNANESFDDLLQTLGKSAISFKTFAQSVGTMGFGPALKAMNQSTQNVKEFDRLTQKAGFFEFYDKGQIDLGKVNVDLVSKTQEEVAGLIKKTAGLTGAEKELNDTRIATSKFLLELIANATSYQLTQKGLKNIIDATTKSTGNQAKMLSITTSAINEKNSKSKNELILLKEKKDILDAELEILKAKEFADTAEGREKLAAAQKKYNQTLIAQQGIEQKLINIQTSKIKAVAGAFGKLSELVGQDKENALAAARIAQLAAVIDTLAGANKAFKQGGVLGFATGASIIMTGMLRVKQIQDSLSEMKSVPIFQQGGYVGGRPHSQGGTIIEAERGEFVMSRNAVESIGLETLNQMNEGGGGAVNVTVTGNVMTQDFVEGELAESIKEAVRRGSDFGIG